MVRLRLPRRARARTTFTTYHNLDTPLVPSLEAETDLFTSQRALEGRYFARQLYITIRNRHFMSDCSCPVPTIYTSKEEAIISGIGHLRFYVTGNDPSQLSVVQASCDPHWHCECGKEYLPVYQELIRREHPPSLNRYGKRVAETGELELITENADHKAVEKVLPGAVHESTPKPELPTESPMESSWINPFALASQALTTMTAPLHAVRNFISGFFQGETNYDVVDTRKVDDTNGNVSVKRLKRHCGPSIDSVSDELPGISWADDATSYIGKDALAHIAQILHHRVDLINRSKVTCSHSLEDLESRFDPNQGEDLELNIAIHKLMNEAIGPVRPSDSTRRRESKYREARQLYRDAASTVYDLMQEIYTQHNLEGYKTLLPKPPRKIVYDKYDEPDEHTRSLQEKARVAAEFIEWVLRNHMHGMEGFEEALSKVFVDANAVHKREIIPSYIKPTANESSSIPGSFPTGPGSAFEDVSINDLNFTYRWEYKFPSTDQENTKPTPVNVNEFRPILEPKGILKKPKDWPTPQSPKYVATPERNRRLDFVAPVASYASPKEVPAQVMSLKDAINVQWQHPTETQHSVIDWENIVTRNAGQTATNCERFAKVDKSRSFTVSDASRWTEKEVERDDAEMGLRVNEAKYGPFLDDLRQDMVEKFRASAPTESKPEPNIKTRRQILQQIRQQRKQKTSQGAHEEKGSRLHRFFRKAEQEDTMATETVISGESQRTANISVEQVSAAGQVQQSTEDDDLAIATKKLEDLEVNRQLADEVEDGIRRAIEERFREAEKQRKEAERKRREEKRRQEQEQKRREEAEQASRTGLRVPKRPLIESLTNDWEKKVAGVLQANPNAKLADIPDGSSLTKRDFVEKLLEPQAWLNDNVIIGSISHIATAINQSAGAQKTDPKCVAFSSYFWPRLISAGPSSCGRLMRREGVRKNNFFDIDTILIPICDGMHWTLAVVRPGKRTVAHLDSMRAGAGHRNIKEKLLEWVKVTLEERWVASEWSAIDYEAPRQTNGYDCGVFTITNALCLALGLDPKKSYSAGQLTLQRRRLAAVLLNGGFTDDFSLEGF
ncbi:hypothetical protein B0T20DRAFT_488346 [Sordaria brevicollis]|uniref:Ubiquitin-like protease family profile domain-containing protein n=1 Tax=Sordaria brevicollis TaxID=83679 RepID=A0AAE0P3C0_SORBR|nr:hypothetical protein B0T20DRAFT_488346 [Sordaria brevicollis]